MPLTVTLPDDSYEEASDDFSWEGIPEDYNQQWMSETGFSQLKEDDGEKLRSQS